MSWHIAEELHQHPYELIGEVILGLNDGITTTLVFALGVAGASGKYRTVVLVGIAEMLAGGVAMFLGGYMSAQSQKEAVQHQIAVEQHEIEHEPEEEREELRRIYQDKGFRGTQLAGIVEYLTRDKERWLENMIRDELMLRPGEFREPRRIAAAVGVSFVVGALIPILPFLLGLPRASVLAALASIAALFGTGVARSRYSHRSWFYSGLQMVLVGVIGTAAGLVIGRILAGYR